ncbi:integrating conjugative element protein [Pasteurella oralis]|uniref:integrating conjugative element protein n=1 Tax=Pasteurella oralis TaxID=1071947 RepID=UPI000C7BA23B|nr:integrating conjugative element protein [Pasteurella oralis]
MLLLIKSNLKLSTLFLLSTLYCFNVQAKLHVIADLGGESAVRFYESIQPIHTDDAPQHPDAIPQILSEELLLPVISHKWSVGKIETKSLPLPGAIPLFLIGYDQTSIQWLEKNKTNLINMGATGLIINVNTLNELNTLRQIAQGLELMPVVADSLADRLGIFHYPLLITSEGLFQ